ncbi:MAG: bifunctional nuclease family protein [Peptococcaceae bacterium]|nr:bifunctional nuclease family protein [Candidatus Syntrophopropionicum ammoniitolerans]
MIPVKVKEIAYDVMMNPVILLIDEKELKALPIWIGPFEAHAIGVALQGIHLERPLTHDLLNNVLSMLESRLSMVVINDVTEGTYFAKLHLWRHDQELIVDCRPSDAIALALRTKTPIYLTEKVAAGSLAIEELLSEGQDQELKELLGSSLTSGNKKDLH